MVRLAHCAHSIGSFGVFASFARRRCRRRRWCRVLHGFVRHRYKWATSEQDTHTRTQQKTTAEENKTPESDKKKMEKGDREKREEDQKRLRYIWSLRQKNSEFAFKWITCAHTHTNGKRPQPTFTEFHTLQSTRVYIPVYISVAGISLFVLHTRHGTSFESTCVFVRRTYLRRAADRAPDKMWMRKRTTVRINLLPQKRKLNVNGNIPLAFIRSLPIAFRPSNLWGR